MVSRKNIYSHITQASYLQEERTAKGTEMGCDRLKAIALQEKAQEVFFSDQ